MSADNTQAVGGPPLAARPGSARFCDRSHAISEEPRETYFERYPKAVGVWRLGDMRKHLCAACGRTFERNYGMTRSPNAAVSDGGTPFAPRPGSETCSNEQKTGPAGATHGSGSVQSAEADAEK